MHFPVLAHVGAVRVQDHRSVVVKSGSAAFKKRGDDDHAEFFGEVGEELRAWPRDFFGEREVFVILDLAKINGGEELLEADDLCALACGLTGAFYCFAQVCLNISTAMHLDQTNSDRLWMIHVRCLPTAKKRRAKKRVTIVPQPTSMPNSKGGRRLTRFGDLVR